MQLCLLGCCTERGELCFAAPSASPAASHRPGFHGGFLGRNAPEASAEGLGSSGAAVPLLQPVWGVLGGGWVGTPTCDAGGAQAGWSEAAATPNWLVNK